MGSAATVLLQGVWTMSENRAKSLRQSLAARGLCQNAASHGKATHGILCRRCRELRRDTRSGVAGAKFRIEYTPIDEALTRAPVRLLRAMRHFGWASCTELLEALGIPEMNQRSASGFRLPDRERNTLAQALGRLVKSGLAEKTDGRALGARRMGIYVDVDNCSLYRITAAGRAEYQRQVTTDMEHEWAPMRRAA